MEKYKENIITLLSQIGLSEKESEIYFALLELGRNNVSNITKETSVNRTTGYVILNKLVGMGLVEVLGKKPKLEYIIESPNTLVDFLKKKIERNSKNLEELEEILPQIHELHHTSDRPIVKYYEGISGLKQVYDDTLTSSTDIVSMANYNNMHETLPDYFKTYYRRRAKRGIKIKGFVPISRRGKERRAKDNDESRTLAFIPNTEEYLFTPEIDIYDNKVMIASWKEKLGIIIESKEISDALRVMFKLAWKEVERLDKDIYKK